MGLFGRSRDLRELDAAFRAVDLHRQLVPEAVKLAMLKLMKGRADADPGRAAALIAYCMVGAEPFAAANGAGYAAEIERRIEAAAAAGDSLDAELVLLAIYAKVIQPTIVARFGLEAG